MIKQCVIGIFGIFVYRVLALYEFPAITLQEKVHDCLIKEILVDYFRNNKADSRSIRVSRGIITHQSAKFTHDVLS